MPHVALSDTPANDVRFSGGASAEVYARGVSPDPSHDRELLLLGAAVDPIAQQVLEAQEPWDAYNLANTIPSTLVETLDWLPLGGRLYTTWAELTDLFENGKTPIPDAHAALRQAAADWLSRTGPAGSESWLERTQAATRDLFDRDGTF